MIERARERHDSQMHMGGGKKGPEDSGLWGRGSGRNGAGIGGVHIAYAGHAGEEEAGAVELLAAE